MARLPFDGAELDASDEVFLQDDEEDDQGDDDLTDEGLVNDPFIGEKLVQVAFYICHISGLGGSEIYQEDCL